MLSDDAILKRFEGLGFYCGIQCSEWPVFVNEQRESPVIDEVWVDDGRVAYRGCRRAQQIYHEQEITAPEPAKCPYTPLPITAAQQEAA